ncbi:MAG: GAF domain-containing protein [Leptolyngbyaceae cyanobacterium SM1_4_3]|nr:GAF domain-containing protein [Leptolyngbyaceae cyanobacterium SM1_4_3]
MGQAPLPNNEAARVKALRQLSILGTAPEAAFDDLTRLAAYICQVPIALVGLVDGDRLWFKSKVGLDVSEISRDETFCTQVMLQADLLVVGDAQQDERFANSPLVQADPAIRFYAGAPLITAEGYGLGTLCVLDYVPRQLNSAQLEALQALARQVMAQLELRRSLAELTETRNRSNDILESITDAFLARETTLLQQAILDGANYTIISTDIDGTIRTFNRAAERMLGYSADEVVGKTTPLLIHDLQEVEQRARELSEELGVAIAPGFECFVAKIRADGVEEREWTYIRKDGSRFPILLSATGLRDSNGNLTGFLGIGSDISDRKQAEEMLKLQSLRSQLLAEMSLKIRQSLQLDEILQTTVTEVQKIFQSDRVLIFRLDAEGRGRVVQEAVAPGWSSTLDLKVQDDCFGSDYLKKYRQGRTYTVNDVDTAGLEPCLVNFLEYLSVKSKLVMPILLKDQFWGLLIVHQCDRPRQWTALEVELMQQLANQIGIALAQAQMLEQATLQSQELARSNADLEQFAYVASHDLQEPLRMVASYLQLLERRYRGQLDDTADEFIDYAVDGAARMQTLINDLLDYSRVDSRGKSFVIISGSAILDRAIANLQPAIEAANATLTCAPLPKIMADATQLTQLFQNLISNALKFHSDQPLHIHVSAQHQADAWLLSVQDNGIGIDSEYADRIFLIFQRLHSRGEYPGTGIGLAICKKIVERHGGNIWVESQPGQGSTFYFTIPDRRGNSA